MFDSLTHKLAAALDHKWSQISFENGAYLLRDKL